MRIRVAKHLPSGRSEVVVSSQSGETLNADRAERLRDQPPIPMLRLRFEQGRDGSSFVMRYDVEGYTTVSSYVNHHKLGYDGLLSMLSDLQVVLDAAAMRRCPTEALVFDPAFVFADKAGGLHFVCVPLNNLPLDATNSPLTLLRLLGNPAKLSLSGDEAVALSRRVGEFVQGLGGIFSSNAYRQLVDGESQDMTMAGRPYVDAAGAGFAARMGTATVVPRAAHDAWTPLDDFAGGGPAYSLVRASTGESWPITPGVPVTVGRGVQADVQILGNPRVSRTHARVSCSGDRVVVQDLHSANQTGVEGHYLAPGSSGETKVGRMFFLADERLFVQRGVQQTNGRR